MATRHKSAVKANRQTIKRTEHNRELRSKLRSGLKAIRATEEDLLGTYLAEDIVNYQTGEIYLEAGDEIDEKKYKILTDLGLDEISVLDIDHVNIGPYIRNTLTADKNESRQDALFDICDQQGHIVKTGEVEGPVTRVRITDLQGEEYYLMVLDGELSTVKPFQLRKAS